MAKHLYKKGNKFGEGRPHGAKNKKTVQWEIFSEYCMNGGLERFQDELEKLEKKDFVNAFLTLLEFHKPKLARTELTNPDGSLIPDKITIEIVKREYEGD